MQCFGIWKAFIELMDMETKIELPGLYFKSQLQVKKHEPTNTVTRFEGFNI